MEFSGGGRDVVDERARGDVVLVLGGLVLGLRRQAEAAGQVLPLGVAPPGRPSGQAGQVLDRRVRLGTVLQRCGPGLAVADELVEEGQQPVAGVAEGSALRLGAPSGQLPGPADAGDPVGEERLVAAFQESARIRGGAVSISAAALQPGQERLPVRAVLPPQAHEPVAVPAEVLAVLRRQGLTGRQHAPVDIRAGPGHVREPAGDPALVISGHRGVEGFRVREVQQRHPGAAG